MAFGTVAAEMVYKSAGSPSPGDIELVMKTLFSQGFNEAVNTLQDLQQRKMYALSDILTELVTKLQEVSLPPSADAYLFKELAELE